MKLNKSMEALLSQIDSTISVCINTDYTITEYQESAGRSYWLVGNRNSTKHLAVTASTNLSWLEWDLNEVYLTTDETGTINKLLEQMLAILRFWEQEMKRRFPDVSFYAMASFDCGEPEEEDGPASSVTLRFWADRGDMTVADTQHLERYGQPVLVRYISPTVH